MQLTRWSPSRDLPRLFDDDFFRTFEEMANRVFGPSRFLSGRGPWPTLNVQEGEDHYLIEAEVPGVKKDELHVSVADGVLTIRGERRERTTEHEEEDGSRYRYVESAYGTFERSFRLSSSVDPDKIEAKLEDGLLRITLPKVEEAKAREIKVS